MVIKSEGFTYPFAAHDLEAHRIGETEPLVSEPTQPSLGGLRFEISIDRNHPIERVGVDRVEKRASGRSAPFSDDEYVHLGHDETAREERCSLPDQLIVSPCNLRIVSVARVDCGQPSRCVNKDY